MHYYSSGTLPSKQREASIWTYKSANDDKIVVGAREREATTNILLHVWDAEVNVFLTTWHFTFHFLTFLVVVGIIRLLIMVL